MRICLSSLLILGMAALGCQPDEFIAQPDDAGSLPVDGAAADGSLDARAPADAAPPDPDAIPSDAAAPGPDATPPIYTHTVDIQPVWTQNCSSPSCHPVFSPDAYDVIVGQPTTELPSMNYIEPGSPQDSYLMHKLDNTHLGVGGSGESMPPGPLLKPNVRDMIRVWIMEGAPR